MGSFCGSNPQTVSTSLTNPNVSAQQDRIYSNVNAINDAYRTNPTQLVAPWNPIQTQAVQGMADNATSNLPWNFLGQGMVGQGSAMASTAPYFYGQATQQLDQSQPIANTAWNPTQYMSPYTQNVIDTTMANINRNNAIQQNGALGNAIAQGNAFGGDRAGVAMGELARNQALASNQTMAQLQQADFNQASQQANAQQQYGLNVDLANNARALQQGNAFAGLGNNMVQAGLAQGSLGSQAGALGNQGQAGAMAGLNSLFNAGSGLQQTQQQQLSSPMTLASWMASNSPGTGATPTSTTYPGTSTASSIAGGLASILPFLFLKDGGRVEKQMGGAIGMPQQEADGGSIVDRYHNILQQRSSFQNGGGAGEMPPSDPISNNVVQAKDTPTAKAMQLARYAQQLEQLQTGRPGERELGYNMMQGMQEGGVAEPATGLGDIASSFAGMFPGIGRLFGSGAPMDDNDPGNTNVGGPPMAADERRRKQLLQMMKMRQLGVGPMNGSGNSPTQAPRAPGTSPQDMLSLLRFGFGQMGGMGRQQFGRGGDVDPFSGGDLAGPDVVGSPPQVFGYEDRAEPQRRGLDPFRYAPPRNRAAEIAMALSGAMAGVGARDGNGLLNPLGNASKGAMQAFGQYADRQQKEREAALRARQIEAQWEQQEAERKLRIGTTLGRIGGQQTLDAIRQQQQQAHQAAQLAEQKRVHDATIAQTGVATEKAREDLRRQQDPTIFYTERERQADHLGMVKGSRERTEFIATGDFPRLAANKDSLEAQAAARKAEAERMGMKPDNPAYQSYVLTGKLPREDQQPLTATDKKFIEEADDTVQANKDALIALREGRELSKYANSGWLASTRATLGRNLPDLMVPDAMSSPTSSSATAQYENVVIGQALAALKSTFGAAPTEGERKILLELQASVGLPHADRVKILDRAMGLAERRMEYNQQKAAQLRNKDYYKPDRGAAKLNYGTLTLDQLKKLDRSIMTPEQLAEAARRYNELTEAAPLP